MFLSQSAHETTGCSHLLESVSSITCVMYAPISTSNPFLTQTNDCRSMEPWRFFFPLLFFFFFFFFLFAMHIRVIRHAKDTATFLSSCRNGGRLFASLFEMTNVHAERNAFLAQLLWKIWRSGQSATLPVKI